MLLSAALKTWLVENDYAVSSLTSLDAWVVAAQKALDAGALTDEKFAELQAVKSPSAKDIFGGVRVKAASERYSDNKGTALHVKSGRPVVGFNGKPVENQSEKELAKFGVFLKKLCQRSGMAIELNEHEQGLLAECFDDEWCGEIGGVYSGKIAGSRCKTLLSESSSGGIYVNPIWFDDQLVQYPLLYSELLPKVDLVNAPRGNVIDSAAVNNPTVTWAASEATAISAFSTTGLVSQIETTVRPVTCSVEMGRDLLADSPDDIGRTLSQNIGQAMLADLDRVIAIGNGSTEPSGIFGSSGLTDIGTPTGGNGAPCQVDDFERLLFAIGKQYRNPSMRCAFVMNDTSYRRARSIPVGAADARRVFGMDEQSYMLLDYPVVINNSISNAYAMFGALAKYRMYRRLGVETRVETAGKTLGLANTALLIVRGRFGGKVVDANAFSFSDNWQV